MSRISQKRPPRFLTLVGTLVLIAAALAIGGISRPPAERRLMIHTDDAGLCEPVNAATIDAMENGCVTSASIMVCTPGFDDFARYAAAHPEMDFGVHLTLTSEMSPFRWGPVLKKESVPSLVDSGGWFWPSERDVAAHASIVEVERELRAQIELARSRGIRISHLDHHMWVLYMRPDLLQLYASLGEEYDLPIRFGRSLPPSDLMPPTRECVAAYEECRDRLLARGMPVFDSLDADSYDVAPDDKRAYFLDRIRRLPSGVSQFVVHCSYDRPGSVVLRSAARRAADTRVFTSAEIASECRRLGIELISHKQLGGGS